MMTITANSISPIRTVGELRTSCSSEIFRHKTFKQVLDEALIYDCMKSCENKTLNHIFVNQNVNAVENLMATLA